MPVVTAEDAWAVLEPHIPGFVDCWRGTWDKWLRIGESVPDGQVAIRARAQSNVLYDLMVYELKHRFADVPEVTVSEKGGFLTLNFSDVILLRFKKLDQYMRSHHIMTRQQKLFSLQLVLPGFPDAPTRVTLGYQLDKLRMNLRDFLITCYSGDRLEWYRSLMGYPEQGEGVILFPVEPDMPKPRIEKKPKRGDEEADQGKRETGAQ
jgi:hypothetical protein